MGRLIRATSVSVRARDDRPNGQPPRLGKGEGEKPTTTAISNHEAAQLGSLSKRFVLNPRLVMSCHNTVL